MEITNLLALIFSSLLCAFGTYGVSIIVTQEPGPFAIFDRIRDAMLPPYGDGDDEADTLSDALSQTVGTITPLPAPSEQQKPFDRTLKGTIYGIFDCATCFGVWFSIPVALLPLAMGLVTPLEYPLVWLASYGMHRFLMGVSGDS